MIRPGSVFGGQVTGPLIVERWHDRRADGPGEDSGVVFDRLVCCQFSLCMGFVECLQRLDRVSLGVLLLQQGLHCSLMRSHRLDERGLGCPLRLEVRREFPLQISHTPHNQRLWCRLATNQGFDREVFAHSSFLGHIRSFPLLMPRGGEGANTRPSRRWGRRGTGLPFGHPLHVGRTTSRIAWSHARLRQTVT